jgi:protein Tex
METVKPMHELFVEPSKKFADETLRQLNDRLTYLRNLQERKDDITRLIDEQGKLTEDLKKQIDEATILTELEDIYLPFKPKKRTRGSIAVELGLQPLADMIMEKTHSLAEIEKKASEFVNGEEIKTVDDAISKSLDIIAEFVSEQKIFRDIVRNSRYVIQKRRACCVDVDTNCVNAIFHYFFE